MAALLESFWSLWWIWIPLIVIAVTAIGVSISRRKTKGYAPTRDRRFDTTGGHDEAPR